MEFLGTYLKNLFYKLFWILPGILFQADAIIDLFCKGWRSYKEKLRDKYRVKICIFLLIAGFFIANYRIFYDAKQEIKKTKAQLDEIQKELNDTEYQLKIIQNEPKKDNDRVIGMNLPYSVNASIDNVAITLPSK